MSNSAIYFYSREEPKFITNDGKSAIFEKTIRTCSEVGFDTEKITPEYALNFLRVEPPYDGHKIRISFNAKSRDEEITPLFYIDDKIIETWEWTDKLDEESQRRLDIVFELICRLTMTHDADYVPWAYPDTRRAFATSLPIHDDIEEPPIFGVYSESVLEQLGGVESFYETEPWYTARLTSGHTVVIEKPLGPERYDHGWTPPTDAEYIETATLNDSTETTTDTDPAFSDPFAALEVGEYGTDLCVHRDDIADEFPNEDLQVVRVYVDEDRNLRRIDSGTYLRSIVEDGPDNPMLFMDKLFEDAPPDATPDDAMPSTILRETIPPEFVRLDDPDGETVVTKVMNLDTDRSKHDLLFSLANIARQENYSPEILQSIEDTVEKLNNIEDVGGFDDWLEDRLL